MFRRRVLSGGATRPARRVVLRLCAIGAVLAAVVLAMVVGTGGGGSSRHPAGRADGAGGADGSSGLALPPGPGVSAAPSRSPAPSASPRSPSPGRVGGKGSPAVNVAGLAYGRSPRYSPAECADMAGKFDVILAANECREIIRRTSPGVVVLEYTNSTNCTRGDPLCTFLHRQPDPEAYFLNVTAASVQEINGKRFGRRPGDRLCSYDWGCAHNGPGTRWTTDYRGAESRSTLVRYFTDRANLPAGADGWFFDNMGLGCSYTGSLESGAAEYGISGPYYFHSRAMEEACNRLTGEIDAAMPSDVYFINNIADYGITYCGGKWGWQQCTRSVQGKSMRRSYAAAVTTGRGTLQEYKYRFSTTLAEFDDNYGGLNEVWQARGRPGNHLYVMWWLNQGGGGVAADSARVRLFALGTHLLYQFPTSYLRYDGKSLNNTPLTGDWFGALAAPLGSAQGERSAVDRRTFRRVFSNGIVLTRFRTADGDDYTSGGTYELGGTYYPVNADGSYGQPVTSVTLRNAESFVGVKAPTP